MADTSLPQAGRYDIDPTHSSIELTVRHLVAAKVRGRFTQFEGAITIAEDPTASSAEVTIQTASVDTGVADRDNHLRSPDFFDVENHPTASFTSSSVSGGSGSWALNGDLTISGVTKPVTLDLDFNGMVPDPWGNTRAVFSATTEVNREDFGLTWNQALETGGVMVSKTAKVEIEVQAVRQADAPADGLAADAGANA